MSKFGNWFLDDDGITWNGPREYFISKDSLLLTGPGGWNNVYDVLVSIALKDWVTQKDLQDLNEAFEAALKRYGFNHNPAVSWEATMKEQHQQFKMRG